MDRNFVNEVEGMIKKFPVLIFAKSYCKHCSRTKRDIESYARENNIDLEIVIIELDVHPDGPSFIRALSTMSTLKTVPQVYVTGYLVGGGDDTRYAIRDGTITNRLIRYRADALNTNAQLGS